MIAQKPAARPDFRETLSFPAALLENAPYSPMPGILSRQSNMLGEICFS
jgi:hypothetical protein